MAYSNWHKLICKKDSNMAHSCYPKINLKNNYFDFTMAFFKNGRAQYGLSNPLGGNSPFLLSFHNAMANNVSKSRKQPCA